MCETTSCYFKLLGGYNLDNIFPQEACVKEYDCIYLCDINIWKSGKEKMLVDMAVDSWEEGDASSYHRNSVIEINRLIDNYSDKSKLMFDPPMHCQRGELFIDFVQESSLYFLFTWQRRCNVADKYRNSTKRTCATPLNSCHIHCSDVKSKSMKCGRKNFCYNLFSVFLCHWYSRSDERIHLCCSDTLQVPHAAGCKPCSSCYCKCFTVNITSFTENSGLYRTWG